MAPEKFAPDWLALREPADHRSRPDALLAPLVEWWTRRRAARAVDLGSGTGSNLRYLAPRLPAHQQWTLVDHDSHLLERGAALGVDHVAGVAWIERVHGDLAHEGLASVRRADLVTASALLDLVSEAWVGRLAQGCAAAGCAALFALTWDGEIIWRGEEDVDDAFVLEALRAHQRRDKGLGPALGPSGGEAAARALAAVGFTTTLASSPWRLGPADAALSRALLEGWAEAAAEQRPQDAPRVRAWAARRLETLLHDFDLSVGHTDLLALPPGT
ncbi:MAG: class I SAM-dependent methyltransferase [Gemmatimonadetes bacterium]|nr:class I SAM-dependent methyltransferase [Gemmatimonadota bacterium]